jgi:hypothetical protein
LLPQNLMDATRVAGYKKGVKKKTAVKKKGGRPLTVRGERRCTLRCSPAFLKKLDGLAKSLKVSRAEAIRRCVEAAVKKL